MKYLFLPMVIASSLSTLAVVARAEPAATATATACTDADTKACAKVEYCKRDGCGASDAPGQCAARPKDCDAIHSPVCGCDGVTYGNACSAAGAGVNVSKSGACQGAKAPRSAAPTAPVEKKSAQDATFGRGRTRVEGCVTLELDNGNNKSEGLRVTGVRVIKPPVAGGSGRVAVSLSEVSGKGHFAYPAVRAFSANADTSDPVQLYAVSPCSRDEFIFEVRPKAHVKTGDRFEIGFQAADIGCLRGDYPCDGHMVKAMVKVVAKDGPAQR